MSLLQPSTRLARAALALALGPLAALLPGCDNISCVFTTGCQDATNPPGPVGEESARRPVDGEWIQTGPPRVEQGSPSGDVGGSTPVVLVFSETMNEDSLDGAFQVVDSGGMAAPLAASLLVGDGRVLVLLPQAALDADDYAVRVAASADPIDLTGQKLIATGDLATFRVVDPRPAAPRVVATYPRAMVADASQTGELVVVFDRALDLDSLSQASFDVKVAGVDPSPDPLPEPPLVGGSEERRVLLWRSVDGDGVPVALGSDREVRLTLSPSGARLLAVGGAQVPTTTVTFETAPFPAPVGASLLSSPPDAIGIANLMAGASELSVQVELEDAQAGDSVDLILFGSDPDQPANPPLLAFQRTVQVASASPTVATFDRSDVDLLEGSAVSTARVADGPLTFAFRLRRGGVVSPLRLLDVDPLLPGIQDPLLDTVAPSVVELFLGGTLRSDQRGLVLSGRASERVGAASVVTDVGDNLVSGEVPPVVGSADDGRFLAAPVGAALLDPGTIACTVVVFDVAGNASPSVSGSFSQHGALGPATFTPGDDLALEVFDARTLLAIAGARVFTHSDRGNGTDFPLWQTAMTGGAGTASIGTEAGFDALVTVEAAGYDRFTFQGVTSARVSVGLVRAPARAAATLEGSVRTDSLFANVFAFLQKKLADTRRPADALRTFDASACQDPFGDPSCPFPDQAIRPDRLGATSVLAGDFLIATPGAFAADDLLQGFELGVPQAATDPGDTDTAALVVPFLFIDQGVDASELPVAYPDTRLDATATAGIDLGALVDDPATTGEPEVTVETILPGIDGALAVGPGLAFPSAAGLWDVRAAYPGAVGTGYFATQGVVDPDLFLRAALRDAGGNATLRRPRLSALGGLPVGGSPALPALEPLDVPAVALVTVGGPLGTDASLDLEVDDVLPDALGEPGLVELRLQDSAGAVWHVWRVDAPDGAATLPVHVPDLTGGGGGRLASGDLRASARVWAWPDLDPGAFLWSDLAREHDAFVVSAEAVVATLP